MSVRDVAIAFPTCDAVGDGAVRGCGWMDGFLAGDCTLLLR